MHDSLDQVSSDKRPQRFKVFAAKWKQFAPMKGRRSCRILDDLSFYTKLVPLYVIFNSTRLLQIYQFDKQVVTLKVVKDTSKILRRDFALRCI